MLADGGIKTMYAITPKGIGEGVGVRAIKPEWDMMHGETFTVDEWNHDMVLAEDEISLKYRTDDENLTLYKDSKINDLKKDFTNELLADGFRSSALGSEHNYDAEQHNIDWVFACIALTATSPAETPLITCDDLLGNADSKIQRIHDDTQCLQLLSDCMSVVQGMKDKLAGLTSNVHAVLVTDPDPESAIDLTVW